MQYRRLDSTKVTETVRRLHRRAGERFPDAGLTGVIGELVDVAEGAAARARAIRRPHLLSRTLTALVVVALPVAVWLVARQAPEKSGVRTVLDFITELEAALGALFFIGAALVFVFTLETRIKRRRALAVLYELRSLAHIVDMHQLTKDPEALGPHSPTGSSPERKLSTFELGRYFDYCSEALSLIAKVAASLAEGFSDPVALQSIDEIENLCTGLSRKIWQKMMLLPQGEAPGGRPQVGAPADGSAA